MAVAMRRRHSVFNSFYAACACGIKSQRRPAAALLGRFVAERSKYFITALSILWKVDSRSDGAGRLAPAAQILGATFWFPHWPTCMCVILRQDQWNRFNIQSPQAIFHILCSIS
jgi:hypothetical protein